MIDTHCHLAGLEFVDDLDAVIERARSAGVTSAVCILDAATRLELDRAADVRVRWPDVRFAAGVHPHRAAIVPAADVRRLVSDALDRIQGCAVGEIGLDYHYDFAPRQVQQDVFAAQIALACDRGQSIVIHTREADADTLRVLDAHGRGAARGVFHCFTGDQALADEALARGFHISFSGIVTFPRAHALRAVAARVPADRWLVETDSPYLAPVPHRGRRNEPARVADVLAVMAQVRGLGLQQAALESLRNAEAAFSVAPSSP